MKTNILCFFLFITAFAGAQVVNIPDANFKNALLSASTANNVAKGSTGNAIIIDTNADGQIQVSEVALVYQLNVSNSTISSLQGIEAFANLQYLDCSYNQLTQLDLSENLQLNSFSCSDNAITYINIKNGIGQLSYTSANVWSGNPLTFICIDGDEAAAVTAILTASGYSNVSISPYCTFTPGGDFNVISGDIIFDETNNGCDNADATQSFIKVTATNGAQSCTTFTNTAGNYTFYTQTGSFTVTPQFENNCFTATPASAIANLPMLNMMSSLSFCVTAGSTFNDMEIVMVPIIPAVAGNMAIYKMVYKNKGNQVISGAVSCTWNTFLFNNVYAVPPANYAGTSIYSWNFNNLKPFESREIVLSLNVNGPTSTPPVATGDVLGFTAMTSISSDNVPSDNNFTFNQKVVATAPSNSITCIEGDTASPAAIGDYLHYVVNFKNTGTAMVQNIVITHELDPAQFDISSLELLNSSHEVTATVTDNTIEFVMRNANLAVADHGNLLIKVKTKPGLQTGASVSNTAKIFYDYKVPVQTNEANTVFGILSTGDFEIDAAVKVYPNPARDIITIQANSNVSSVELYDIQGRQLQTSLVNNTSTMLDISSRAAGMYFLKITTQKGVKVEKVIKK